jgi:hypothetical protein
VGYKVALTETCEDDRPNLITHVETVAAPVADGAMTPRIHQALQEKALLPAVHLADTGFLDAELLVESRAAYGVELLAPGLVERVAGTPPGLYLTPAGLRFLAALAGVAPALFRRLTVVHDGRAPAEPEATAIRLTRSTPRLRRARQHLRHTQGTIRLRQLIAGRVSQGPGQPVALIGAWEGPLCRSAPFRTADGALQTRNARTGGRMPYGRVYPDARAVLVLGPQLIDLIVEWDRGRARRSSAGGPAASAWPRWSSSACRQRSASSR